MSHSICSATLMVWLCSNIGAESQLYDERDIQNAMGKIETIDFHQTVDVGGIKITPYHAGHVLGACMFMIEIAGVKVRV